jgi:hypothetical protein
MKRFLFLTALIIASMQVFGANVDLATARASAQQFVAAKMAASGKMMAPSAVDLNLVKLEMNSDQPGIAEQARPYYIYMILIPVITFAAFLWDGIYIGATASKAIRNAMLWAVIAFAGVWGLGMLGLDMFQPAAQSASQSASQPVTLPAASDSSARNILAMHILMAAYFAHLFARTIYLSAIYKTTFRVPEK